MSKKRWEYKTLYVGQSSSKDTHTDVSFEEELNRLGEQGWELVGKGMPDYRLVGAPSSMHYIGYSHLVFKREY